MNRRENQGLQIALVLFVMVALVLGVTSVYFFQQYDAQRQRATAAAAKTVELQEQIAQQNDGLGQVMVRVGHPQTATVAHAVAGHADFMQRYGSHLPAAQQTYRRLIETERSSVERENQNVKSEQDKLAVQQQTIESLETVHNQRVAAANEKQKEAHEELDSERTRFTKALVDINDEKKQLAAHIAERGRIYTEAEAQYRKETRQLSQQVASAEKTIAKQTKRLASFQKETAVAPDGYILEVDYRSLTARIDLGTKDRLPMQQVFSVHPGSATEMKVSGKHHTRKGSVEVIRLLGDHHAVVRLQEYNLKDPILPGDKLYTPVWHPGRRPRFAILGEIHLDTDGVDDRAQLTDLLADAGGIVELDLRPDGTQVGSEITPEIDFLVLGDRPKFGDNLQQTLRTMAKLETTARQLGARVLSAGQLLDESGFWRNRARTYRPGLDAPSPKFPNRAYR